MGATDGAPSHPDFDGLLELLTGEPVVYRCESEPHPATRRLMATLGVRVEVVAVTAISAQDLLTTRDCVVPGCLNTAEADSDRCRQHRPSAVAAAVGRAQTGVGRSLGEGSAVGQPAASGSGPAAPEPERADPSPSEPAKGWSRKPRTREEVIEAIRAFHASTGRPPIRKDGVGPGHALAVGSDTIDRLFGSFGAAVTAAGLDPATTTKRAAGTKAARRSGGEPKGPAVPHAAEAAKPPARPKRAVASRTKAAVTAKRASPPEPPLAVEPEPVEHEGQSDPRAFAILDLLALIRDLDRDRLRVADDREVDEAATALVRRLARAALDEADPADLGRAVLAQLDEAA